MLLLEGTCIKLCFSVRRGVKLTTHLHLMSKSRMRGAVPPIPNTPSWRGARLKAQRQLYLYLYLCLKTSLNIVDLKTKQTDNTTLKCPCYLNPFTFIWNSTVVHVYDMSLTLICDWSSNGAPSVGSSRTTLLVKVETTWVRVRAERYSIQNETLLEAECLSPWAVQEIPHFMEI